LKSVAARIRLARRASGLTQSDLADQLDIGRSAVAQWERSDGSHPTASNLAKLSVLLGCSFEWLATGRGGKRPANSVTSSGEETAVVLRHFARDDAEDHILAVFRGLDEWDQKAVILLAETLSNRSVSLRRKVKKT